MSGQDSIRGYLFQTLIAMLASLDNDWDEISIEPETTLDKTDIIWISNDGNKIVSQVKSSINNFTKPQILEWLLKLKDDNPNALEYRVDLVGSTEVSVKKFFNQLSNCEEEDFGNRKSLHLIKDKIKVNFFPFDYSTMLGASISLIDKFLSLKSINVDYFTKELIAGGMVNQLLYFSTNGENLKREKFEAKIVEWIRFNYSEQFIYDKADFKLLFYYNNKSYENQIENFSINKIENYQFFKTKIKNLKSLFDKISDYSFSTKSNIKKTTESEFGNLSLLKFKNPWEYENEPVIIEDFEIEFINKKSIKYIDSQPSKEFYNFGRLRETKTKSISFPYGGDKITLEGNEQEKEKKNLYDEYKSLIYDLDDLSKFDKRIRKMNILPIVISNNGNSHKELIKIKLYIPKSVKIFKLKKFPKPEYLSNLQEINSDPGQFFNSIRHTGNSVVQKFAYNYKYPQFIEFGVFGYEKLTQEESKFKRIFEHYYEYTFHQDIPEYTVMECEVAELNTKEIISLPTHIFFKSDVDFVIKYKINCKNDPNKIEGELNYKASS